MPTMTFNEEHPSTASQSARPSVKDERHDGDFTSYLKRALSPKEPFDDETPAEVKQRTSTDWGADIIIALVAFAFGCAQMVITASSVVYVDVSMRTSASAINYLPNVYAYLAVALTTAPLILRREAPWFVLGITTACYVFLSFTMGLTVSLSPIGAIVAVFTVASERSRSEALAAACIVCVCVLFAPMSATSTAMVVAMRAQNFAFTVAAAAAGFGMRMYNAYVEETRRRLVEAERTREELAARRVADERVRIAREVHDITAHSLSAVTIQAAAAERLVELNPAAAKEAIADIRQVSKSALDEIRSMIGVLRGDEAAEKAPVEGTDRLPDVVTYLERAGIQVRFDDAAYDRSSVPAFVDTALFSLAREAATNVVRHANATAVSIRIACEQAQATLIFADNGVGMDTSALRTVSGHGVQGMGERIEALKGTFDFTSTPGSGTTIQASIPLEVSHDDANN